MTQPFFRNQSEVEFPWCPKLQGGTLYPIPLPSSLTLSNPLDQWKICGGGWSVCSIFRALRSFCPQQAEHETPGTALPWEVELRGCAGSGWGEASFPQSSPFGAVLWICN